MCYVYCVENIVISMNRRRELIMNNERYIEPIL